MSGSKIVQTNAFGSVVDGPLELSDGTVHHLVGERLAEASLIKRSPKRPEHRLMTLVAGIAIADPDLTLLEIGQQLERMHERPPRGGRKWQASSVKALLDRPRQLGLVTSAPAPGS